MVQEQDGNISVPANLSQAMETRARAGIEKQVREDMKANGSTQAIDQEIVYRMGGETEAIKSLSERELITAWKFKMSAGEYQKGKK